eukprot:scaffold20049_cov20-Tisochrysis_lutea.AAC.3
MSSSAASGSLCGWVANYHKSPQIAIVYPSKGKKAEMSYSVPPGRLCKWSPYTSSCQLVRPSVHKQIMDLGQAVPARCTTSTCMREMQM